MPVLYSVGRRSGTSCHWEKLSTSLLFTMRSRFHGCILAAAHRPASAARPMVSGLSSMRPKGPSCSRMPSLSPVVTVSPTSGPQIWGHGLGIVVGYEVKLYAVAFLQLAQHL